MTAEVQVVCTACRRAFRVPGTLKGGVSNCPHCRALVDIPDPGGESAYRTSRTLSASAVVGAAALAGMATGSVLVGVAVLVILGGVVAAIFASL